MADQDDQNINEDVEDVQDEQPTPDEPTEEVEEEQQEQEGDAEGEEPDEQTEDEPEPKVSRRAEKRMEELKIRGLIANLKQQAQPLLGPQVPDYGDQLDADPEVLQQLQQSAQQYGQATYNQGLEQAKSIQFETRVEIDYPKVVNKYPQLNPEDRENFNPAVTAAIDEWYLTTTGYNKETGTVQNPNVRYSDFVDGFMELVDAAAGEKVQRSTKNIAKQSAMTGLRPDGSSAKRLNLNQDPSQMNDEELAAFGKKLGLA